MDDGHTYERWTKESNSQFRSEVFTINSGDTIWKEQADVFQENEQWIFQNTVKDQNDGKAIRFTSTVWNDSMVQFSNTRHDFPQQIRYLLKNNNTIHAYIAGPNNKGGMDTIPFNYTRYR